MAAPWYSAYAIPAIEPNPNLSLYVFQDKSLEQLVYSASQVQWLGVDNGSANGNGDVGAPRRGNDVLRWLGESVLRGLNAVLLTTMFPALETSSLNDLCEALEEITFYAHLSRVLGLHSRLTPLNYATSESDDILGALFASYIGAIHRDMGAGGYQNLYNWFSQVVGPYAQQYGVYYEEYSATPKAAQSMVLASSLVAAPFPPSFTVNTPGLPVPGMASIAMDTTGMKPASVESKIRRQNVSMYTSRLMEYAAKNRLSQPSFMFKDNGYQGALIQWTATVGMDGRNIATAVASTKLEAKHLASRDALVALRAPMGPLPRRSKKLQSRRMVLR